MSVTAHSDLALRHHKRAYLHEVVVVVVGPASLLVTLPLLLLIHCRYSAATLANNRSIIRMFVRILRAYKTILLENAVTAVIINHRSDVSAGLNPRVICFSL